MSDHLAALTAFVGERRRLFVLTGAGCSTDSGIPDYRDAAGNWKHERPVQFGDFVRSARTRRRYWARSFVGWRQIVAAEPNPAHAALAELERRGHLACLVTQNVDGLHQRAGSRAVIDLHGRLDQVVCLGCRRHQERDELQGELERANPGFRGRARALTPDGDADLAEGDCEGFVVPPCPACGGVLKPDVVLFGESVPKERVGAAFAALAAADGVLVVGSSLMVWSGYRFVRRACELGIPTAALNLGRTRADGELALKVSAACGELLPRLCAALAAGGEPQAETALGA